MGTTEEDKIANFSWSPTLVQEIPSGHYNTRLRDKRVGVMVHYDGSASDRGAVSWFGHPDCEVSYQALVLDDGTWVQIAPEGARAWHAGVCRPSSPRFSYSDGNSAFFGIAAATDTKHDVTTRQVLTLAWLVRRHFEREGWDLSETWRIMGHEDEAWPRGRRVDPSGGSRDNPIISLPDLRSLVGGVTI